MTPVVDAFRRPLASLRVSVTDRCNMRCRYCMPEADYVWLPRASILSFEEIARVVGVFTGLGVDSVRLTGGEPLLRKDLASLVAMLRRDSRLRDLALTTNGTLLAEQADQLGRAGLSRVTVSFDTLRPERLERFSGSARHAEIVAGIRAARRAAITPLKINSVIIRGYNDDELADLIAFGRREGTEVRFIEYMDVGGATQWSKDQVVPQAEMLERLTAALGAIAPVPGDQRAPATRFRLADGTTFGIIASVTAPFCASCDRSRLTADGTWFLCLYGERGIDLRALLRHGATDADLAATISAAWRARTDRGAEQRLAVADRGALYQLDGLRADPHREMHTRGG